MLPGPEVSFVALADRQPKNTLNSEMFTDPVVETAYLGFPFCIRRELNLSDLMFKEGCLLILCSCIEKMVVYGLWECQKDTV